MNTRRACETLLSAMQDRKPGRSRLSDPSESKSVRDYDFRRPQHLSGEQMRDIQRIHGSAVERMQKSLGRYFGVNLEVSFDGVEELTYGLLLEGLPEHTYAVVLDLSPMEERGLLLLDTQLCLAFVDRVLGGTGGAAPNARSLTAIDQAVAESAVDIVLHCLRDAWRDLCNVKLAIVERRNDLQQGHVMAVGEAMLVVSLTVSGELGEGQIRFCLPIASLKTAVESALQRAMGLRSSLERTQQLRAALRNRLDEATLPITAAVGSAEISVQDLLKLSDGDILRLDQETEDPIIILVGGRPAFLGKMGLRGRRKAVQVVERIDIAEGE